VALEIQGKFVLTKSVKLFSSEYLSGLKLAGLNQPVKFLSGAYEENLLT
jgi:hypothetical protein